jgi:hypothetical protein
VAHAIVTEITVCAGQVPVNRGAAVVLLREGVDVSPVAPVAGGTLRRECVGRILAIR